MNKTLISLPGYQLKENLYQGIRTLVYRGIRNRDHQPVVLKILRNEYPSFNELVQFRNQYTIAKNLDFPGIIQTYDLEAYGNGYILIMEDFGGISLSEFNQGKPLNIQSFLPIAIQLSDILHGLYQSRVIHKDIKPANILIHPETKQVKLIDFSISSLLPHETHEIQNPNILEGTLAYISPEQTGRMNRGIDYRTDFYSLGITFYELITGELPFQSTQAMAFIHHHLAQVARPVHQVMPNIPEMISKIITKLMAKTVEERYQSALGIKYDLENCLKQLKSQGKIEGFELGQWDICDRFLIPEKLYGREQQTKKLLTAFERVSQGSSELLLVAGCSGIGKTAIVNEVHKPIVRQNGYFIKGKFDPFQRNIPFNGLVQALGELVQYILHETDLKLQEWKEKILQALGENAQVIIELIPELEQIIGQQSSAPQLSDNAAKNRLHLLFKQFIKVFTNPHHPLVIFLDDLQWADTASLQFIQQLMSETEQQYLLLIGAYRDNEVSPVHPLMLSIDEIKKLGVSVHKITLQPLKIFNLNCLIADTLHCSTQLALPLSQQVFKKTKGNPFFINQFLKVLYEEGLIRFDWNQRSWECDIAQVKLLAFSDDVVQFVAARLKQLNPATQTALKLAACMGSRFDLATLAIVREKEELEIATDLWVALKAGLIVPTSEIYRFYTADIQEAPRPQKASHLSASFRFLHDRIQQAAYSLIEENKKKITHLKIGKLLLNNTDPETIEDKICEIVNQMNLGSELITQPAEKYQLAQFNFIAAKKAKTATAYKTAFEYSQIAHQLLPDHHWQQDYELSLSLYELSAETAYLAGDFSEAERLVDLICNQARNTLEKVKAYEVMIQVLLAKNQLLEAIQLALHFLSDLGIHFPQEPDQTDIDQALQKILDQLPFEAIESLIDLPIMTDQKILASMRILSRILNAAYLGLPNLLPLIVTKQVELSMIYGNMDVSPSAYANYGLILCSIVGDIESGYRFGNLALTLLNQIESKQFYTKTLEIVCLSVKHWKEHINSTLELLLQGYKISREIGDFESASFTAYDYCAHSFVLGRNLIDLEKKMLNYSVAISDLKQRMVFHLNELHRQTILNLIQETENPLLLQGEAYDEEKMLPIHQQDNDFSSLALFYIDKLFLCYLFDQSHQAIDMATQVELYLDGIPGQVFVPIYYLYDALSWLSLYPTLEEKEKEDVMKRVVSHQIRIETWAKYATMNYAHKLHLLQAEKHRVLGERMAAIEMYDRAISEAKENEYLQEEALANERAAQFYLDWGKTKIASVYLQEAYYCYAKWGAKAKINHLEKRYSVLLQPILEQSQASFNAIETLMTIAPPNLSFQASINHKNSLSHNVNTALDFAAILQASQSLSSQIKLEELLHQLTQLILQNSGGDYCGLILPNEAGLWQVKAIATSEKTELCSQPLEGNPNLPIQLIQYVKNTQEIVVIDDLKTDLPVLDQYLIQQQPRSISCFPILNQGHLVGVLYLQNQLITGVFTEARILILNFLFSQAAISLENARLYQQSIKTQQQLLQQKQELEQSKIALSAHKSALRAILDTAPIWIWMTDTQGKMLFVNQTFCDNVGASEEEFTAASHYQDVMAEKVAQNCIKSDQACLAQETPFSCIENLNFIDGKQHILEVVKTQVKDKHNVTIGIIGLGIDVTEQERMKCEIQEKNSNLEKALQELQQAQIQLVQSEKMSALGNLVAGVAHEINNPVGFITGNLHEAQQNLQDLIEHLNLYRSRTSSNLEIEEHEAEIDLEYLLEDLPKMMDSMIFGCNRIKNISTSLRTFSRADQEYKTAFHLHDGLESTLLILKHRLKAKGKRPEIVVIKQYGDLPEIECFPGQLNQVFMNILANAIDMFDEVYESSSQESIKEKIPKIIIKTTIFRDKNTVEIRINDNGKGMNEAVKTKIFDHLFTTKSVGKGTGLGLAIAHQIVTQKHGGKIYCISQASQGTEFIINLPM